MRDEHGKPIDKKLLIESARISARIRGCLCNPKITLREFVPKVYTAECEHADACPLVSGTAPGEA